MSLVLDASAVVKWFVEEEESGEMRRIRDLHLNGRVEIHVPQLLFVELANALRYVRGLTAVDVVKALEALRVLRLNVVEDLTLLGEAVEIAFSHGVTVCDALYVALARATGSKLVTYDKELLEKFDDIARGAGQLLSEIGSTR